MGLPCFLDDYLVRADDDESQDTFGTDVSSAGQHGGLKTMSINPSDFVYVVPFIQVNVIQSV